MVDRFDVDKLERFAIFVSIENWAPGSSLVREGDHSGDDNDEFDDTKSCAISALDKDAFSLF